MSEFPFRELRRYQAKKTFRSDRSNDTFTKGEIYVYLSSVLNHYDGIEICTLKELASGRDLLLHADNFFLEHFDEYFNIAK